MGFGLGCAHTQRRARWTYWRRVRRVHLSALTVNFPQSFGRAIGFTVLGMLIGFFIGLVGELLKHGWLMVIRSQSRNAREAASIH